MNAIINTPLNAETITAFHEPKSLDFFIEHAYLRDSLP